MVKGGARLEGGGTMVSLAVGREVNATLDEADVHPVSLIPHRRCSAQVPFRLVPFHLVPSPDPTASRQ